MNPINYSVTNIKHKVSTIIAFWNYFSDWQLKEKTGRNLIKGKKDWQESK